MSPSRSRGSGPARWAQPCCSWRCARTWSSGRAGSAARPAAGSATPAAAAARSTESPMSTTSLERWLERWMLNKPFTARRAAVAIAVVTAAITVAGGMLMTVLDRKEFDNVWIGLWWAVQTVTTVGYGDVTPKSPWGRILAGVVMLAGIGFLTVVTAAITAALVEGARRRRGVAGGRAREGAGDRLEAKVDEVSARLERLEALLRSGDGGRARTADPPPP